MRVSTPRHPAVTPPFWPRFDPALRFAPSYSAVYGGLGAVVIFMLWLYLVSLILLVGAEVNDEVRKAAGQTARERE